MIITIMINIIIIILIIIIAIIILSSTTLHLLGCLGSSSTETNVPLSMDLGDVKCGLLSRSQSVQ